MKKKACMTVWALLLLLSSPQRPSLASSVPDSLPVTGVVQHLVLPSDKSTTFFSIIFGRDFPGTLPDDIDKITVDGPDGACPLSLKNFKYLADNREFWSVLPERPAKGTYKITIHAGNIKGVVSTTLTQLQIISPPNSLKCETNQEGVVETNRPAFTWETKQEEGRYSQLQIKNSSGKLIYDSAFEKSAGTHRPLKNILEPGHNYSYRVRINDHPDWAATQNRAQSNWVPFKTAAVLRYDYHPPDTTDDGWETGHIKGVGVDLAPLKSMVESIINKKIQNIHGLLLIKDGRLVFEEYFDGYGRYDLHLVASVTKSVNSLLFGQAVDQGLITDLDQPAWNFFPEYDNPKDIDAKKKITLRHLLTMTAGLDWDYLSLPIESPEYPTRQMITSGDPVGFILNRKVVAPPGRIYNYNDGLALMLGEIIKRVSHMPVGKFAEARLFGPLGIKDYQWARTEDGITETQGGLFLRPRDMGKIGQLVLQDGQWNKEQIVSSQWLRESTREHTHGDRVGYGYQWRTASIFQGGRSIEVVWASGYGGQRIFIVRDLNIVAVITSEVFYNANGGLQAEHLFESSILPAVLPNVDMASLPTYTGKQPEKLVGCYQDGRGVASGCVAHEGGKFLLSLKFGSHEETCELRPIFETEIVGRSTLLGDFKIILKLTDQGQLDCAEFKNGLRTTVMRQIR